MSKPYIYIAGPYTNGDVVRNVRKAVEYANIVVAHNAVPFIPRLCRLWHTISPRAYEVWTAWDLEWLKKCDGLIRIPGESNGADLECKVALERGLKLWDGTACSDTFPALEFIPVWLNLHWKDRS